MRFGQEHALPAKAYYNLAAELHEYDVDQNGWEHEEKGLEFNANHVLKELVRARRKDMFDTSVVECELAPDAVQYALRFGRWANIHPGLMLPTHGTDIETDEYCNLNDYSRKRLGAWALAEIKLADITHQFDHQIEHNPPLKNTPVILLSVSRLLIHSAELSAHEFGFDLQSAFRNRLATLRKRFGIPHPSSNS